MADLNALIAQGYQFQPLPDPFAQYAKMQQLQQGQQANQLNQLNIQKTQRDFEEQNQLRGLDPTSPTYLSDVTKISPKLGLEFGNLRQEGENKKLEFKTKTTALLKNKIDMLPEAYARADTPEAYISLHESIHADPELGPWLNSIGATKEQGRAKINEAIQNGTFAQLRAGSMQSVADIKDQMGNVAYAADAQGAGGPAAAAPAVVQQSEGVGPIRESAPSSALVTPSATNALAPPAPAINALAAVSPADKFKDRIKAIDAEVARGNSNPAFNKSTAWADAKKRLEEERKSLMLSADQQIRMTTPNPVQINVGDEILTIDQNPNSLTYNKETAPRRKMNLTAKQQLDKVTPNPVQTRLGNVVITRDMNPNSPTYGKEIQPREEIGLTAQQELAKTTPNPVDTRLGDRVVTKDMNPNSPTYGQVISQQTINQTLNEQYNQTAPKPVDTRLGNEVVTRDMNPGSPTYGQVISKQTIGFTAEQALNNTSPKPEQINDGKQIYFIDKNPNSPTYGQRTGAPAVSVKMTPGQEASNKISNAQFLLSQAKFDWEKANPSYSMQQTEDGSIVAINTRTRQAYPVTLNAGQPPALGAAIPNAGAAVAADNTPKRPGVTPFPAPVAEPQGTPLKGKSSGMNESQGNATAFGMRMASSHDLLKDLENKGVASTGNIGSTTGAVVGLVPFVGDKLTSGVDNIFNVLPQVLGGYSPQQQQVLNGRINFITAVLRKESGAAISPGEFSTAEKLYFPRPGDDATAIKQKQNARELSIKAMKVQAGPGAKSIDETTGGGQWKVVK